MEDIITLLQREIPNFSKRQQTISKYILDNCDSASFMTAGRLAKEVGVSESTVVRFSKELGYEGFPQLRKALQDIVRGRFKDDSRIFATEGGELAGDLLSNAIEADIEKLRSAKNIRNTASFHRAMNALFEAEHVYMGGGFGLGGIAYSFRQSLSLLREHVYPIEPYAAAGALSRMKPGDVLLYLSLEDEPALDELVLRLSEQRLVHMICIGRAYPVFQINIEAESASVIASILAALLSAAEQFYGLEVRKQLKEFYGE